MLVLTPTPGWRAGARSSWGRSLGALLNRRSRGTPTHFVRVGLCYPLTQVRLRVDPTGSKTSARCSQLLGGAGCAFLRDYSARHYGERKGDPRPDIALVGESIEPGADVVRASHNFQLLRAVCGGMRQTRGSFVQATTPTCSEGLAWPPTVSSASGAP